MIHYEAYEQSDVKAALDKASDVINGWVESLRGEVREKADSATDYWDGVNLRERIALALLEARGILPEDMDRLDELVGERGPAPLSDVYATWERWVRDPKRWDEVPS